MLNHKIGADNSTPAEDFVTYRRVANIIDLGTAAGDLARAFECVFGSDTSVATGALDFKDSVKFQVVLNDGGPISEAEVSKRTAQEWDTIHVHFLTRAEDVFFKIAEASKMRSVPELAAHLSAFKVKIDAGRRLEIALM